MIVFKVYTTSAACVLEHPGEICIQCEECGRVFFNGELSYQPPIEQPTICRFTGGSCCYPIEACHECPNNPLQEGGWF